MRRKEYFDLIRTRLSGIYGVEEAGALGWHLLESCVNLNREAVYAEPDAPVSPSPAVEAAIRELERHRPLQYVLGHTEFYGLPFRVDERVLIPRPETEELVRWIAGDWRGKSPAVLDIGTGSGAIAVALARSLPGSAVTALDVSPGALEVAGENARANGVEVRAIRCDVLRETPAGEYDMIVSNPPYVRESERTSMHPNVLDHEPGLALFVPDDDPLRFYRRIAELGLALLKPGGALYLEINEAFGAETAALLEGSGYTDVRLRKDLFGKDRMIRACKPLVK